MVGVFYCLLSCFSFHSNSDNSFDLLYHAFPLKVYYICCCKMRVIIFILAYLTVANSLAQDTWSLQQCIDHAYKNNLQIKQAELSTQIQEQQITVAKGQMLPNLNGFASHTYNWGQRIDPFTNQFANSRVQSNNFYLNSQVTLFNGFQNKNSIKRSMIDHQIQEQNTEGIKNDIALAIAANYLQILFNEEALKIAREQITISNQQVQRIDKMVRAGSIPEGNLLDLQAQLANDELNLVTAENQLAISTLALQQLLQLDSIKNFKVVIPEMEMSEKLLVSSTPGQVYDAALSTMPQIRSGELQMESALVNESVAKGRRLPTLSLSGSVGTGYSGLSKNTTITSYSLEEAGITASQDIVYLYNPVVETSKKSFGDQVADNLNESVGLNLSVPIFNGFATKTSIETAKINQEIAQVQLDQTKNQLRNDIEQAHVDAIAAMKRFNATLKSVEAQQQSFEYAKTRFEVGMINSVDFSTAKNNLVNAESQLLQAKFDYLFKIKILEFYQGKSLAF